MCNITAWFSTKQNLLFCNSFFFLFLNIKQTNNGIFSNKTGENFHLAKTSWKVRVRILNRVYNYYFHNLVKAKKRETKSILIDEKNYTNLVIYFTIYVHSKSIKMLSLYYHELTGKVKESLSCDFIVSNNLEVDLEFILIANTNTFFLLSCLSSCHLHFLWFYRGYPKSTFSFFMSLWLWTLTNYFLIK